MSDFLTTLRKIWFNFYPRSSHTTHEDTSGFEHVFVGETTSSKVDGFHNWIQYYLEEKHGRLNYLGFVYTKQVLVPNPMLWNINQNPDDTFHCY